MPSILDKFFQPLKRHFHWDHFTDFCLLVVTIAFMWGRRNVANLYRHLEAPSHRTRLNNFFWAERWDPEAALRQKAQKLLHSLSPGLGETVYVIIDDSKTAKRGRHMETVTKMKDPTTDTYIQGHHYICAIVVCRASVTPCGLRLYVKKTQGADLGVPFRKTTELAAQLIQAFKAPAGVQVLGLLDAYDLCHIVVKACRARGFHIASTLRSNRRLRKQGWQLKAGRYGRHLFRRRRTETLVSVKPHGQACDRYVDARWVEVSSLGFLPVVFSRKSQARKFLGLVTDALELSAAALIQAYEKRWAIEQFIKDATQLLGLGHDQNRSSWAAVIHLHLVCFADALLTHRRMTRHGAQGQRKRETAAGRSVRATQEALRCRIWYDLVAGLKEKTQGTSVLSELERLRVA